MSTPRQILNSADIESCLQRMAEDLAAMVSGPEKLVLVGIRTHGVTISKRLQKILHEIRGWDVPAGVIDITLYRDDLARLKQQPVLRGTEIDFDMDGRVVALVDDVLFTGRTIRCALTELMDYGRPRSVRLVVLVDREGLRELPIQSDVTGLRVETQPDEKVDVRMGEDAKEEGIWVFDPESTDS